jgi:hypothetical protein
MLDARSAASGSGGADPGIKRRSVLKSLLAGSLACSAPVALAQGLVATPARTEGPFYPDELPLDQDNDLIIVCGHRARAAGEITDLAGPSRARRAPRRASWASNSGPPFA